MRLPKSIKVGFRSVPVTSRRFSDASVYGQYHVHEDRIDINRALAPNMRAMVLVHEVLHAMFATAMPAVDDETEETIIRALTPQIVGWIRDNPKLIEALKGA